MPIAFITGATSGIGLASAEALADLGYNLIICGRRTERLQSLKASLPVDVFPLSFDVRDRAAVSSAIDSLPPEWQAIDVLVNNAGNAHGLSKLQEGDIDDWFK